MTTCCDKLNEQCQIRRIPLKRCLMTTAVLSLALSAADAFGTSSFFAKYPTFRTEVQKRAYARKVLRAKISGSSEEAATRGAEFVKPVNRRSLSNTVSSLNMLVDEQREFEMKLGKAVDTLRKDYPDLLTTSPDFSIYDLNLEAIDPSGVKLHSLKNYKNSFRILHALVNFFYCSQQSGLTFRLVYDCARKNIRVSWNAYLIPRAIYGGYRNKLHVDGISVYEIDRKSGLIVQHRVEHLLINNAPVRAPQGIFRAIEQGLDGKPVLGVEGSGGRLEFHQFEQDDSFLGREPTSLFSSRADDYEEDSFDQEAFDRKNASRKKFGLKPISREEFLEIEIQVKQLETAQKQKAEASLAAELSKRQKKKDNLLTKIFGNILEDTCETNYDCQRPEVCCDFGFKKMCCSSGTKVSTYMPGQLRPVDLPIPIKGPGDSDYY